MPALSRNTLMRPQGAFIWAPELVGTAIQWPLVFAKYSHAWLVGPNSSVSRFITSSIGSRLSTLFSTVQMGKANASWPVLACASAERVSKFLKPTEVMKSACTSTFILSDQAATCFFIASLPAGTQWSQNPIETLPAAPAVRTWTSGSAATAAPNFSALRREKGRSAVIRGLPWRDGCASPRWLLLVHELCARPIPYAGHIECMIPSGASAAAGLKSCAASHGRYAARNGETADMLGPRLHHRQLYGD